MELNVISYEIKKDLRWRFKNGFWSTPNILFKAAMAY